MHTLFNAWGVSIIIPDLTSIHSQSIGFLELLWCHILKNWIFCLFFNCLVYLITIVDINQMIKQHCMHNVAVRVIHRPNRWAESTDKMVICDCGFTKRLVLPVKTIMLVHQTELHLKITHCVECISYSSFAICRIHQQLLHYFSWKTCQSN